MEALRRGSQDPGMDADHKHMLAFAGRMPSRKGKPARRSGETPIYKCILSGRKIETEALSAAGPSVGPRQCRFPAADR